MFNTVGQQLAHHAEHQDRSAHVLHPGVGSQSGSIGSAAIYTGYQPNLNLTPNDPNFPLRTAMMRT